LVDSDRLGRATIEMIRACACNLWDQGVDGLYLAHWFGMWPYAAPFYQALRELPEKQLRRINEMYRMSAPRYRTGSGYWFVFRLDATTRPTRGQNAVRSLC
jgi:hypothetical protein